MFFFWSVHNQNIWKKLRKATYSEFLTKIFFWVCISTIYLVSFEPNIALYENWQILTWNTREENSQFSVCMLPFIAELTWIKSIRCGGFECPINDSTCENQNQVDCCLLTIFFCKLVRTASKVDLLGIFLLLKIQTDKVNLSYKVAN